ncbi:MAG: sodium-dependent bicarbonate transport family permease [Candidatus Methylacidiphilales bacterium]|nr:sodium-dependent bicarbonate transport family permease [Candidatus Methylacidiphilales bacterium]
MDLLNSLLLSLLSPMVLAFVLGVVASLLRSDLKIPEPIYVGLTIYLLFAIGLKGGAKLDGITLEELWKPMTAALALSAAIPVWSFHILKRIGRFDTINAAALAAHYGSVSAVTFGEALVFLSLVKVAYEPFMPALLAVMEVPAIIIALLLAGKTVAANGTARMGKIMHELLTSKGIVLLVGGMIIGFLSGHKGSEQIAPFFEAPFRGVLTLFLLEIGLVTGSRLGDIKKAGLPLIVFALAMPLLHGLLGVWLGSLAGLGVGGATVLGTLAASASYIAAPAAVRIALPQASPAIYLTASLALTFPFNIVIGIPVYFTFAKYLLP